MPGESCGRRGRVLVIDDNSFMRGVLSRFLTLEGYEAVLAVDGESGLELAASIRPDMVLLDVSMPGMDGVSVLGKLLSGAPETQVVVMSGGMDEEAARECLRQGARDYVSKPLSLDKLGLLLKEFGVAQQE